MKLVTTVVLLAASATSASVFAGQQHGRAAVYASAAVPAATQSRGEVAVDPRYGRASVYSTGRSLRGTREVTDLTRRFGRA